ncbi:MAG: GNAT family N-acetyltransferase, partial [Sediminibacterium sp.]
PDVCTGTENKDQKMMEIRKAGFADIPLVRELTFATWPQTYSSLLSKEQVDYMLEMIYSPASLQKQMEEGSIFIIVYDDKLPVGFAAYKTIDPLTWKLDKLYVLASQQGKGTGKFIINYILDEIKAKQAKALQLQVNRQNKAKDFYERLGFKIIQTADFDIGNGYFMNDYVMELVL